MIRLIALSEDVGVKIHVGGTVDRSHKTFDVDLPEVEKWLREKTGTHETRSIIGFEVIADNPELPHA